jgi:prefoldin subunit 5
MTDAQKGIGDFAAEHLRRIEQKLDRMDSRMDGFAADLSTIKETTGRSDIRLKIVEAHMTGFMSSAKYLENEIDSLRGRVEAIEAHIHRHDPS